AEEGPARLGPRGHRRASRTAARDGGWCPVLEGTLAVGLGCRSLAAGDTELWSGPRGRTSGHQGPEKAVESLDTGPAEGRQKKGHRRGLWGRSRATGGQPESGEDGAQGQPCQSTSPRGASKPTPTQAPGARVSVGPSGQPPSSAHDLPGPDFSGTSTEAES
ncbi:hypothetical protein H1C71_018456, partial [Ictidomys tridecemlineatus]